MGHRRAWFWLRVASAVMVLPTLLSVIMTLTITPMAAVAGFPGEEKIVDRSLIEQDTKGIGPLRVIVTLKGHEDFKGGEFGDDGTLLKAIQIGAAESIDKALSRPGLPIEQMGARLQNAPVFAATISPGGLKSLAGLQDVAFIEEDRALTMHTAQGIPLIKPAGFRASHGGTGVAIAIVDTGVNYAHPALGGGQFPNAKVIGGYDFIKRVADPMDERGHGTMCAGVAAGLNTNWGAYIGGVAPEAKIYALVVCGADGTCNTSAMIAAWDWCVTHQHDDPRHPIMIISTSIGSADYFSDNYCRAPGAQAIARLAAARGIAIFVSAGNGGICGGISSPSCVEEVIAIGAVYDGNVGRIHTCVNRASCIASLTSDPQCPHVCSDGMTGPDQVCCYSNTSRILALLAPSDCAYVPTRPGSRYSECFNGTSAACPYAAGAAAVIQSYARAKTGKFLSVSRLRTLMTQNGDPIRDPKSGVVKPRVNLARTIEAIKPAAEGPPGALPRPPGGSPGVTPAPGPGGSPGGTPVAPPAPSPGAPGAQRNPVDELRDVIRKQ